MHHGYGHRVCPVIIAVVVDLSGRENRGRPGHTDVVVMFVVTQVSYMRHGGAKTSSITVTATILKALLASNERGCTLAGPNLLSGWSRRHLHGLSMVTSVPWCGGVVCWAHGC